MAARKSVQQIPVAGHSLKGISLPPGNFRQSFLESYRKIAGLVLAGQNNG